MAGLYRVTLVGNLGKDAVRRVTPNGTTVVNFTMATTQMIRTRDGRREEHTDWHKIAYFGKPADAVADYLKKGKQVYIEGRPQPPEKYTDRDGNERTSVEIRADVLVLLGGGGGAGRQGGYERDESASQATPSEPPVDTPPEDDIPF